METPENQIENHFTLGDLHTGARLLIRTKKDWRTAAVSCRFEDKAALIVCSPSGRTYRLTRKLDSVLILEGGLPLLKEEASENWRENFTKYDSRW